MSAITTLEELRRVYAAPSSIVQRKSLDRLDPHCRRFIELSPFFVLSSSDAEGHADVSPRGGPPGFLAVEDDKTLLVPDHPGNNRLDTLTNVLANPEVALVVFIPGVDEVLRVAGVAEIRDDEDLRQRVATGGKLPKTVLRITVREAFLHCAKALMRSRLWDPEARIERSALPTIGEMLKDQLGFDGPVESREEMVARYKDNLY